MKTIRQWIWIGGLAAISTALCITAAQSGAQTFASPDEAMQAMVAAAEHNDTAAILKLLGPGSQDIASTGSTEDEKQRRMQFVNLAHEKTQLELDPANPNRATFLMGTEDWPFPIPLVRKDGRWSFDTAKGRVEILAHRVGRNELDTVEACRAFVEAQLDYSDKDRNGDGLLQYAQRLNSTPGKQDGLYWEGAGSLIPKEFAAAAVNYPPSATKEDPYHGYYFHVLKAQGPDAMGGSLNYLVKGQLIGGFALVAWPAQYGMSGIKTFIVNHLGVVYEKDLGPNTETLARSMPRFDPDRTWRKVDLE